MNKEKQIEEMLEVQCVFYGECEKCPVYGSDKNALENCTITCRRLYEAGYRKQIEGEWLPKDNFDGRCTIAICGNCGTEKAFPVLVRIETISTLYPYCQKCGAKMKGGAE